MEPSPSHGEKLTPRTIPRNKHESVLKGQTPFQAQAGLAGCKKSKDVKNFHWTYISKNKSSNETHC